MDHFTSLDPKPVDGVDDGFVNFNDQSMALWTNVVFADNYYRSDGNAELTDVDGEFVEGAYNVRFNEAHLNGDAGGERGYSNEHSDTHAWYHGTINTQGSSGSEKHELLHDEGENPDVMVDDDWYLADAYASGFPGSRDQTGYFYSRTGGGLRQVAGMNPDFLSESTAARQSMAPIDPEWANIGYLEPDNEALQQGSNFVLDYMFEVPLGQTAAVSFFLDTDHNPYTGYTADLGSTTVTRQSEKTAQFQATIPTDVPSQAAPYFILAKIVSAETGKTRYFYASQHITIASPDETWLEAEASVLTGAMTTGDDILAGTERYLWAPTGTAGTATYTFDVEQSGDYTLWGRVIATNSADDSFFVRMDDDPMALWDMAITSDWAWDRVGHRGAGDMTYSLTAGMHTIVVSVREDGAKLDKLLLTNNADTTPTGIGPTTTQWIETEVGSFTGPMTVGEDADASAYQYAWTPEGTTGSVSYTFTVDATDDHLLWGRVLAANSADDSFFVQIDDGPTALWDTAVGSDWVWDRISDRDEGDLVFPLDAGQHTITVSTREDGAKLDNFMVTNNAAFVPTGRGISNLAMHWLEAEAGALDAPMVAGFDLNASAGQYVWTPSGTNGSVSFTVTLDRPAQYAVWGRVLAPNGTDDSFFVQIDDGPTALWDTAVGSDWRWGRISNRGEGGLVYTLSAGEHTITVSTREDGTKLDKLLLVDNTDYTPLGRGPQGIDPNAVETRSMEAEWSELAAGMTTGTDVDKSGGQFVWTPSGSDGSAQFTFSVVTAGDYALWGRVLAPTNVDDSFFVKVDDGPLALWDTTISSSWVWDRVSHRGSGEMAYSLTPGDHTVTVYTREDGTKLDRLMLTPASDSGPTEKDAQRQYWIKIENATLQSPMTVGIDTNASSNQYLWTRAGANGSARYTFAIDESGDYSLWGRVLAPDSTQDSFFVQIDNGLRILWDTAIDDSWTWDRVADRALGDMLFNLDAGEHTLTIFSREPGTKLDKLFLTNDAETSAVDLALSEDDWLI